MIKRKCRVVSGVKLGETKKIKVVKIIIYRFCNT